MPSAPEFRISEIGFSAGPAPGEPSLTVKASPVVVLVGPNNSGKSIALNDMWASARNGDPSARVVRDVRVKVPEDPDEAEALFRELEVAAPSSSLPSEGVIWVSGPPGEPAQPVRTEEVRNATQARMFPYVREILAPRLSISLNGRRRFELCNQQPAGDLIAAPQNHLAALFQDDRSRKMVRELIYSAFDLYFVIDPTNSGHLRIRLSEKPPPSDDVEQSLSIEAREFHAQARHIQEFSDGVQAFTGLVAAVMSRRYRLIFIDEPDAFLHPLLARRLGAALSQVAVEQGASLICATHSASFLMGCITQGSAVTIVRLTYERGVASARSLSSDRVHQLVQNPLLRSANALDALFHKGAVITEADADRAFYEEINRRLLESERGADDTLFMNAQNWQTTAKIAAPLRHIGIPAAIVVDLDSLTDETGWSAFYAAAGLSEDEKDKLEGLRATVARDLRRVAEVNDRIKTYKQQGIEALDGNARVRLVTLIERLADLGIFIVPVGELEQWMRNLGGRARSKRNWVTKTLELLGSDPDSPSYVRPSSGDVWAFMDDIATWIRDPNRAGIPLT